MSETKKTQTWTEGEPPPADWEPGEVRAAAAVMEAMGQQASSSALERAGPKTYATFEEWLADPNGLVEPTDHALLAVGVEGRGKGAFAMLASPCGDTEDAALAHALAARWNACQGLTTENLEADGAGCVMGALQTIQATALALRSLFLVVAKVGPPKHLSPPELIEAMHNSYMAVRTLSDMLPPSEAWDKMVRWNEGGREEMMAEMAAASIIVPGADGVEVPPGVPTRGTAEVGIIMPPGVADPRDRGRMN